MSDEQSSSVRRRVCFLTLVLTHYRLRFHELVRAQLARSGVDYDVVYSDPLGDGQSKRDTAELEWGHKVPVRSFKILGHEVYWQKAAALAGRADLTIMGQENKLLINYVLMLRSWLTGQPKLAFFGHGRRHNEGAERSLREAWKRILATRVHWWFPYTPAGADLLNRYGFPVERMTVANNTIDVGQLTTDLSAIEPEDIAAFRAQNDLGDGPIGTFIGSIYPAKRVAYLIEAALDIKRHVPDFQLIIAGAGSGVEDVRQAASKHEFVHLLPPCFGREKALLLKASRALLIPGAVGLVAIDSFAAARPLVTCAQQNHGPEFDYLENGVNAVVLPKNTDASGYASEVTKLLIDHNLADRLSAGAATAAGNYSIENMAENFTRGILSALDEPLGAQQAKPSSKDGNA